MAIEWLPVLHYSVIYIFCFFVIIEQFLHFFQNVLRDTDEA